MAGQLIEIPFLDVQKGDLVSDEKGNALGLCIGVHDDPKQSGYRIHEFQSHTRFTRLDSTLKAVVLRG